LWGQRVLSWKGLKKEGTHERESVVRVCCMFGWIVLFVSQVIKLFGRQNKETEETLRERERKREKKNQSRIVSSTSIFLSFFLPLHSCAKLVAKETLGTERL